MTQDAEKMAAALIDHVKRTHTPRLALLEDRITAALEYMKGVSTPNMVTLVHIERYLTGGRDALIALSVSNKIEESITADEVSTHAHTFLNGKDLDTPCITDTGCTMTWREYRTRAL